MRTLVLLSLLLSGCASLPPPRADSGHVFEYVRSNRDGSRPETILIYLPSAVDVEVVKVVARCTDAAYVTATIDPHSGSAKKLVAGRLARDGGQRVIGTMQYDVARQRLTFELGAGDEARGRLDGITAPWHLYDYDFATLVSNARYRWPLDERATFDLVRLMSTEDDRLSFEKLGTGVLLPQGATDGLIDLRVEGGGLPEGRMTRRASDGAIVAISSSERNHLENRDFAMRLVGDRDLSYAGWTDVRRAHWAGCPE